VFAWMNTREVDAFAASLAEEVTTRIPVDADTTASEGRKQTARLDKAYVQIFGQAGEFAKRHPLNVYKKARLANRFKWALHERGYSSQLVDDLTYRLAAVLGSQDGRDAN
jgi:hypothetical protein